MEQNREPRNKHSNIWPNDFEESAIQWGKTIFLKKELGKIESPHANERCCTIT